MTLAEFIAKRFAGKTQEEVDAITQPWPVEKWTNITNGTTLKVKDRVFHKGTLKETITEHNKSGAIDPTKFKNIHISIQRRKQLNQL